ncbi:MAG: hypothetical protein QOF09_3538 [Alphaproteobacteria bacterium]|jgi:hypothetical protein|nr:hypothetical protein [Alphaproteobacteria bacterium]
MKALSAALLLVLGLAASAWAGDYTLENRPELVFKGSIVHQTPYPQGQRAASVWKSDACWRGCTASCNWKTEYCVRSSDPDTCRPQLDACDRACQRDCRGLSAGPLLGFFDF